MLSVATAPSHRAAPPIRIQKDSVLLFSGDSTTSADRDVQKPTDLGRGFAFLVSAAVQEHWASPTLRTTNRAVAGETIAQLEARFARDLDEVRPTIVTILVGVNDICRRFEGNPHSGPSEFVARYRRLVGTVAERCEPGTAVVLMEPFLLPISPDVSPWREPLDEIVDALREFAAEDRLPLVPLDALFARAATRAPGGYWLWDGIHPTPAGCALIARAWMEHVLIGWPPARHPPVLP